MDTAYGCFKVGDLFDIKPTKSYGLTNMHLFATKGKTPVVVNSSMNNGVGGYVELKPLEKGNIITYSDTTTSEGIFYQPDDFIGYSHVQGLYPKKNLPWSKNSYLYFKTAFSVAVKGKYSYGDKFNRKKAAEEIVYLPITCDGSINFKYMEERISELEEERISELTAYLTVSGLDNYVLTEQEQDAINKFNNHQIEWDMFNTKTLFGKSTRGRRLKSLDRISGDLPFVTAGEENEGISAYIGNDVTIFSENTSTIDMFGSAKYRNYKYGADDHVAVVHTENIPKYAAMFITTALHKAAHTGQFDYSRNFYAKDADALMISLPSKNSKPDFDYMELFMKATQKNVIKDLIEWKDKIINETRQIVNG
ncbi:MAG: restriction endonuclease subunit S [Clostridia bacterium]|nr:restriction endonuclease subunit S [Clostridia bacterium]